MGGQGKRGKNPYGGKVANGLGKGKRTRNRDVCPNRVHDKKGEIGRVGVGSSPGERDARS